MKKKKKKEGIIGICTSKSWNDLGTMKLFTKLFYRSKRLFGTWNGMTWHIFIFSFFFLFRVKFGNVYGVMRICSCNNSAGGYCMIKYMLKITTPRP